MFPFKGQFVLGKGRNAIVCGLCILLLCSCSTVRSFRRTPRGERLEGIKQSSHWSGGHFRNQDPEFEADEPGLVPYTFSLLFPGSKSRPECEVPVIRTDIKSLDRDRDLCIWLGHASVFIQTGGVRFLMDPVLSNEWPQRMLLRPFKGTVCYTPDDMPELDAVIITHNHWDHLDYFTVTALEGKVSSFICPLGVGEYLEYWGVPVSKIREMDWGDSLEVSGTTVHCLPAIHNSRRFAARDKSFWMALLLDSPGAKELKRTFISGDGGFGGHFSAVPKRYGPIDLAIMEDGQYGNHGHSVHTRPEELVLEIEALSPRMVLPYHNSKYALAKHPWNEPMDLLYEHSKSSAYILLSPKIGEPVDFESSALPSEAWWRMMPCYNAFSEK